ncbi:hypothetical protein P7C73_g5253, partial [Tremellales sp. Uapishka_1]
MLRPGRQLMQTASRATSRKQRKEGDIASVFSSLSGEKDAVLPERFLNLKRKIIGDEANQERLRQSFATLTNRLATAAKEIQRDQQKCIPEITFDEFTSSPSRDTLDRIRKCGTVVIRDVVSEATASGLYLYCHLCLFVVDTQALGWLSSLKEYIALNPSVKAFPKDDKQVFELYWSKSQLAARSHPRSMTIQKHLLSLFDAPASALTPLTYADRLRIRKPGDTAFALGPHVDGGSVERWEDDGYRAVYRDILQGQWEAFDPWRMEHRINANQNYYDGAGSGSSRVDVDVEYRADRGDFEGVSAIEGTLGVYAATASLPARFPRNFPFPLLTMAQPPDFEGRNLARGVSRRRELGSRYRDVRLPRVPAR